MYEELMDILQELHPEVDYDTTDNLIDGKIFDSFDIVTIISEVNARLDITISAEYITPANFNSSKALLALLEKLDEE